MVCRQCDTYVKTWHHATLCDRCLAADSWEDLQRDDYVLLRRKRDGSGRFTLTSQADGTQRTTDVSRRDPIGETVRRMVGVFFDA